MIGVLREMVSSDDKRAREPIDVRELAPKHSIEDILDIENPEELLDFLSKSPSIDKDVLIMTKRINRKVDQPDLRISSKEFIKNMNEKLSVTFGGVYINGDLNVNAELDSSGNIVYDKVTAEDIIKTDRAKIMPLGSQARLVMPLKFRGQYFGNVVLDKDKYSVSDIAIIMDCVFEFSRHIHNTAETEALRKLVDLDPLTGLYTRRKFEQDYITFKQNLENLGQQFSVIFGDIDRFKNINDTYGHPYGDYILNTVGQIVKRTLRNVDRAYRYGGEEVVAILPGTSNQEADNIARRINDAIRSYRFGPAHLSREDACRCYDGRRNSQKVRMSMGVASSSDPEAKGKDIVMAADELLLKVKRYCRDAVMSNSRRDIYTNIAGLQDFMDFIGNKIMQCNRDSSSMAVLLFDVVKFSETVSNLGSDDAWDSFYNVARWFFDERHHFDYVARVCDRDNMVVSFSSKDDADKFLAHARHVADDWHNKVSCRQWPAGGNRISLDFAVGGCVYHPSLLHTDKDYVAKRPELLFGFAENMANVAGDMEERLKVELYTA